MEQRVQRNTNTKIRTYKYIQRSGAENELVTGKLPQPKGAAER